MVTIFNKTKVKRWMKKAHKSSFGLHYGYGYVTDGNVILIEETHMQPTVLELFGTLTPECRPTEDSFKRLTELPTAPIELLDSKLEYDQSKGKVRLLYNPKNGDKVVLDQMYFELIAEPANHRFFTNEQGNMVYVTNSKGNYVYAVIAPMRIPGNELDHFEFVVAES